MNNQNIWIYNPKLKQWFTGYLTDINDDVTTIYNSELKLNILLILNNTKNIFAKEIQTIIKKQII